MPISNYTDVRNQLALNPLRPVGVSPQPARGPYSGVERVYGGYWSSTGVRDIVGTYVFRKRLILTRRLDGVSLAEIDAAAGHAIPAGRDVEKGRFQSL